jgi:uncharacterized protein with ParB-like and HNH nuclease domain
VSTSETDLDIEPTEEEAEDEPDQESQFEIINYPADTTLRGFYDQWKNGQLNIPHFQRGFVWDLKRSSKLIESFLLGLPVPNVFLYKKKSDASYLIIDGQQRITSIVRYLSEDFDDKKFRLKSVAERFEGRSFSDLPEDAQFRLNNAVLRAIIIQQISPDDDTSIYKIFERLNTGGINLNPMEVRQSISYQYLIDTIKNLNLTSSWRSLIGYSKPDKRLKDVELILRIMALRNNFEKYEKPMKGFLTSFAENVRNKDQLIDEYAQWFEETSDFVFEKLGEKPFNYRGRINYGVLDSVMSTRPKARHPDDFLNRFEQLKESTTFDETVTSDTSDTAVVKKRLNLAFDILWA